MKEIQLYGVYGDERKHVRITTANGMDGGYQIFVNDYYQGILLKRKCRWVAYLNENSQLYSEDILILGELIEQTEKPLVRE